MLSYEEREALEILNNTEWDGFMITIKNLIEKQSKEIEELKEKIKTFKIEDENIYLQFGEITEKKRWKDKIKSKIEELQDGTYDAKIVLQSLLEKE